MTQPIRVPNLPIGKMVDENGIATPEEQMFRQALLTLLQTAFNNQGVLVPSQTAADVLKIQNNVVTKQSGSTTLTSYSCQFGTILYSPSTATYPALPNDFLAVSMNDGTANQAPLFKHILELDNTTIYPSAGAITGYGLVNINGTQYKIALYALS